jgi:hypothetical protein
LGKKDSTDITFEAAVDEVRKAIKAKISHLELATEENDTKVDKNCF